VLGSSAPGATNTAPGGSAGIGPYSPWDGVDGNEPRNREFVSSLRLYPALQSNGDGIKLDAQTQSPVHRSCEVVKLCTHKNSTAQKFGLELAERASYYVYEAQDRRKRSASCTIPARLYPSLRPARSIRNDSAWSRLQIESQNMLCNFLLPCTRVLSAHKASMLTGGEFKQRRGAC
jgi:hypothetical protein